MSFSGTNESLWKFPESVGVILKQFRLSRNLLNQSNRGEIINVIQERIMND